MKYSFIIIFFLLFVGCKKQELDKELEKSIIEYQSKIPIPNSDKNDLKDYLFVYVVDISLKGNDTIVNIVRRPSGIPKNTNYYGIYEVDASIPVVIYDESNLGGYFIKYKVRNSLLKKYELSERIRHFVDYPPVYSYVIRKDKINFLWLDTISDNWKR
jgi:hypothetical protein